MNAQPSPFSRHSCGGSCATCAPIVVGQLAALLARVKPELRDAHVRAALLRCVP